MADFTGPMPQFDWQSLDNAAEYARWREWKIAAAAAAARAAPVEIERLDAPGEEALDELRRRVERDNFSLYRVTGPLPSPEETRAALRRLAALLGLRIAEAHRSAGSHGIVAIAPSDAPRQRGYIPYTTRPINWHTDGYYNAPEERISAFVLHCVRPASDGGVNAILDHELAYIRLRDIAPAFVAALMREDAMTIPENREPDGTLRPASVGPVFYPDPSTGRMQMRYTARTRSIAWADDPATQAAQAALREILTKGDPLEVKVRLAPGEGLLCNNVLHNRTGFAPPSGEADRRLLYRVRFANRVERSR